MLDKQQVSVSVLLTPPHDPQTPQQWQNAADAAEALLKLEAARSYALVTDGVDVDADRCRELLELARQAHGIEPNEDAVQRLFALCQR